MRLSGSRLAYVILVLMLSVASFGGEIDDLISALPKVHEATRGAEMKKVAEFGAEAVPALFAAMGGDNHALDKAARQTLEVLVHHASRPGADSERQAVEAALLEVAGSERPSDERIQAIRMLSFAGGSASVPVLAGLFEDETLREIARWALARIPGDEATRALAGALPLSEGAFEAGLIHVLAWRGDTSLLPQMRGALGDHNRDVRLAAIQALGRIGTPDDGDRLYEMITTTEGFEQDRAVRAYVELADGLAGKEQPIPAYLMYQRLVSRLGLPEEARMAGLIGLGETGGEESIPILMEALLEGTENVSSAAHVGLVALADADPSPALAEAFLESPPDTQRLIIQILKERGDEGARAALVEALSEKDPSVRSLVLSALAETGHPDVVRHFLDALEEPSPLNDTARQCLVNMPGEEVTRKIGDLYARQSKTAKPVVLEILGERGDVVALPVLLEAVTDKESTVRSAAVRSLSMLPKEETIPAVLDLVDTDLERDRMLKEKVAAGYWNTQPKPPITATLKKGREGAVIVLLGYLPDEETKLIQTYAAGDSPAVRAVALARLANISRASALPLFREAIQSRDEDVRREGIRGMGKAITRMAEKDSEQALLLADEAFVRAETNEEKAFLIEAYGTIGSPAALSRIEPYLEQEQLRDQAAWAAITLANALGSSDRDAAIEVLRKIGRNTTREDVIGQVVEGLESLGVSVDLSEFGYITVYWISGPFSDRQALREVEDSPPRGPIIFQAPYTVLGESHGWKTITMDSVSGFVDLAKIFDKHDDCGAYLYANIMSHRKRVARLLLGSDDDIVVWLNGAKVHEFFGDRGCWLGQDSVDVILREGVNALFLKVLQGRGDWGCAARVVEAD